MTDKEKNSSSDASMQPAPDAGMAEGGFAAVRLATIACLACVFCVELGYLANILRHAGPLAAIALLVFCCASVVAYLVARYASNTALLKGSPRLMLAAAATALLVGIAASFVHLTTVAAGGDLEPALSQLPAATPAIDSAGDLAGTLLPTCLLAAASFVQGFLLCLGLLQCLNGLKEQGAVRMQGAFTSAMIAGAALFVLVCWLESPARIAVFHQLPTCALILLALSQRRTRPQACPPAQALASAPYAPGRAVSPKPPLEQGSATISPAPGRAASPRPPLEQGKAPAHPAPAHPATAPPAQKQRKPQPPGSIAKPPIHLNRYTHFTLFAFQLALGLSLGLAMPFAGPVLASIAALCAIAVCTVYHIAAMRLSLSLGELGKVALPSIVLLLFCIAAGDNAQPGLAAAIAFAASIAFIMVLEMMNINWLVRTAQAFNLDAVRHIASGRLPLALGITSGLALGAVVGAGEQQAATVLGEGMLRLAAAGAVAAVVVFAYAFLPFNQGTPVKEGMIYSDLENIRTHEPSAEDRQGRPFKELCAEFGSKHGLTPREQEVLFLLACGYYAETIAQILIVSASTVRTHVYRIYTKTDLHSQQELIVRLDNEFEGKK